MSKPPDDPAPDRVEAPVPHEVRTRSLRGGVLALLAEGARSTLVIGSLAVLARLLAPADFGLVAMVSAVVFILTPLATLGLGQALLQVPSLSRDLLSAIFWTSLALGTALTLLLLALAPLVARLFGRPELTLIAAGMAPVFVIRAVGTVHQSLLLRRMHFGLTSAIELVALIVATGTGISLAATGFGYWALVWQELSFWAAIAVFSWLGASWLPGPFRRGIGLGSVMRYGGTLTASTFLAFLRMRLDHLLLGRFASAGALGLYVNSSELLARIIYRLTFPFSGIAISTLSRLQFEPDAYRDQFRTGVLWTASIGLPVLTFVALDSEHVILGLLGAQWLDAVPILQVLIVAASARLLSPMTAWVFQSLGHTDRQLRLGVVETILYVTAFSIGVRWGPIGLAAATSIVATGLALPRLLYCFRPTPLSLRDLAVGLWRPAVASLVAILPWFAAERRLPDLAITPADLAADLVLFLVFYVVAWLAVPGGLTELLSAARSARGRQAT